MPNRVSEKVSIEIAKSEQISNDVIAKAVEQTSEKVPDEVIQAIIEQADIGQKDRDDLMKNFKNEKVIQERVKSEFLILYKNCKKKRDDEVANRIKELNEILLDNNIDMPTQSIIEKIVAKKMAENIYSDIKKGTRIYTLAQVFSVQKMFEKDIVSKVEKEYRIIEEERGEKEGRFDKDNLEEQIILSIAKNVGYKYRKTGVFVIPQSQKMRAIPKEIEEKFIIKIQSAAGKELSEEEITEVKEEIRGIIKNKQTKDIMLLEAIQEMPNKDRNIEMLSEIINNERELRTLHMVRKSGLMQQFMDIPYEKREKVISLVEDAIGKRKQQIIERLYEKEEQEEKRSVSHDEEER